MANADHIEKLSQGAKVWNQWRKDNRGIIPDFEGATFTLSQRQLGPIDCEAVNLQHANLQNAFLYYAQLNKAKLANADFRGANLTYARLENADLTAANLGGANLEYADFKGATLSVANIADADLSKVKNLTQGQIDKAKGNKETLLPDDLAVPLNWLMADQDDEVKEDKSKQFLKGHTQNFYALLHVSPLATTQEIRSAYRKLAKIYHPDLNPDRPEIVEEFQLLSEVFEVLSDPAKRREYDRFIADKSKTTLQQNELFG